jgi:hypothetical protein
VNKPADVTCRLEQFASGAVFCQMLDAYFKDAIPMHKACLQVTRFQRDIPDLYRFGMWNIYVTHWLASTSVVLASSAEHLWW